MSDETKPADHPQDATNISRRTLFKGVSAGAATLSLGTVGQAMAAENSTYSPQFFTGDEMAFLHAACDRLIPQDKLGGGAIEAGVPAYIDGQMMTPYGDSARNYMQGPFVADAEPTLGMQQDLTPKKIYRLGIADVNSYTNQSLKANFNKLTPDQMDQVLTALEKGEAKLNQVPAKIFFEHLLKNTKEGFFCDPIHGGNKGMIGWTLIGFPGARADFMDWVTRNEKYPLPPVSVDGSRAKS